MSTNTYPEALDENNREAWEDYVENVGATYATLDDFEDIYRGQADFGADYAQQLAEDLMDMPTKWPMTCIDWDQAWRELTYEGYWISDNGHVFCP